MGTILLISVILFVLMIVVTFYQRYQLRRDADKMQDSEQVISLTDDTFNETIGIGVTLVDFWAPWCGPCKAIGPVVEDLANTFGDKIKFTKCNVDNSPVTPGKFGIKAIPTLIFFKGGDVVEQITGMVAKSKLEEAVNKLL